MRCDEAESLIDAWADDALDAASRAPFAAHLDACARCRAAVDASRRLSAALAAMPSAVPSPAADARTLAAVAEEIAWSRRRARLRRALIGAGGVAAAAAVAVAVFVAAPATLRVAEEAPQFAELAASWLRYRAAPALLGTGGPAIGVLATLLAVAVIERFAAARPQGVREAR